MNTLRAVGKLLHAIALIARGWYTIRFEFPGLAQDARDLRVQQWAQQMLTAMGIALVVRGTPPAAGPLLLICNHVSWLDILTIHAARHVRFVSKSGVKDWPVIGTLSTGAGTLYIERERRRDALRVVHRMTEALKDGDIVAIFPEGTTSDGQDVLPFHANLLQAALSAEAPIQPAALRFADGATGATSQAPRYIGDDNLVTSLWNTLTAPPLQAVLQFGKPQHAAGRDRRKWARDLHDEVEVLGAQTF